MLSFYLPSAAVFYLSFMYLYSTFSFVLSPVLLSFFLFSIIYLISHYRKTNAKLLQNCCKIATKMQHDCYKNQHDCCRVAAMSLQSCCKGAVKQSKAIIILNRNYVTIGHQDSIILTLQSSNYLLIPCIYFFYFSIFPIFASFGVIFNSS